MIKKRNILQFLLVSMTMFLTPILTSFAMAPNAPDIPVQTLASDQVQGTVLSNELLVKFAQSASKLDIENAHKRVGTLKIGEVKGARVDEVRLPKGLALDSAMAIYRRLPGVIYVEPNHERHAMAIPNDPYLGNLWGFTNIRAPQAWDATTGDTVTVAVVDTGVNYNHEDLTGKVIKGYDYSNNDADPRDDNGHGTHVSGTIAATANNGKGVVGISWGAKILAVKVLNRKGSGTDVSVSNGIRYAADNGAKIISLSLGGAGTSSTLSDAILYAQNKGCLVIAAAGNDGANTVSYPAGDLNVIGVAASTTNDQRASYSNYGWNIDVAAPGGNNDGTASHNIISCYNTNNTSYVWMAGTSMATPHVSGLAALILSRYPDRNNNQLARTIFETADDLGSAGRDDYFGYGRINAERAVKTFTKNKEEDDTDTIFSGTWSTASSDYASGRAYSYSASSGASVTYPFYGSGIYWVGYKSSSAGIARVYIDDTYQQDTDLYGTLDYQRLLYQKTGLPLGKHQIKIEVTGTKNAASSGNEINVDAFDIATVEDTTAPVVTGMIPSDNASKVAPDTKITVTFSEDVDTGTAFSGISVKDASGNPAIAQKSINKNMLVITPASALSYSTTYTVSIPAGSVKDLSGNPLASDKAFSFSTAPIPDATPPVTSLTSDPAESGATGWFTVAPNITLTANETGTIYYKWNSALNYLVYSSQFTALSGANTLWYYSVDMAGNTETVQSQEFKVDTIAPVIISSDPTRDATGVPVSKAISISFDETITPSTAFGVTTLKDPSGTPVAATTLISGAMLTIVPVGRLGYSTTYTVDIPEASVKDIAGNDLAAGSSFNFTTQAPPPVVVNNLTVDKPSPQVKDTTITVTCDATGGAQLLYQFWINDGSGWQIAQAYSMSNKFIWRPAAGGFYKISVYVKDKNSANYVDALKQLSYVVYDKAITINSLTTDKASPQAVGIPITVTADATGGAELLYQFWVNDGVSWKVVQGYSASDTYLWTPTVPGNYKLSVYVKDYYSTKSLDTYMQIGFVVK